MNNSNVQEQTRHALGFIADLERDFYMLHYRRQPEAGNTEVFFVVDADLYDRVVERARPGFSRIFDMMTTDAARDLAAHMTEVQTNADEPLFLSDN